MKQVLLLSVFCVVFLQSLVPALSANATCCGSICYTPTDMDTHTLKFLPAYRQTFKDLARALDITGGLYSRRVLVGRVRSGGSLWDEWVERVARSDCKPLEQWKDIAGFRVTCANTNDATEAAGLIKAALPVNWTSPTSATTMDDSGYRSLDMLLKVSEVPLLVQVRTPYMTLWADWKDTLYREGGFTQEKQAQHPEVKEYVKSVSQYLLDLDLYRSSHQPSCPDILVSSVLNWEDQLKGFVQDGCFYWGDLESNPESAIDDELMPDEVLLTGSPADVDRAFISLAASKMAEDCSVTLQEATEYVRRFVPSFRQAVHLVTRLLKPSDKLTGRLKTGKSLADNINKRHKHCHVWEFSDIIGLRVTSPTINEVYKIRDALVSSGKMFPGSKPMGDISKIRSDTGYRSIHIHLGIEDEERTMRPVEVQLRTPFATYWADWSHDLLYKGAAFVQTDAAVGNYSLQMAQFLLDLDLSRNTQLPACPQIIQSTLLPADNPEDSLSGCFVWSDTGDSLKDPLVVVQENRNMGWSNAAFYSLLAVSVISVVAACLVLGYTCRNQNKRRQSGLRLNSHQFTSPGGGEYHALHDRQ